MKYPLLSEFQNLDPGNISKCTRWGKDFKEMFSCFEEKSPYFRIYNKAVCSKCCYCSIKSGIRKS